MDRKVAARQLTKATANVPGADTLYRDVLSGRIDVDTWRREMREQLVEAWAASAAEPMPGALLQRFVQSAIAARIDRLPSGSWSAAFQRLDAALREDVRAAYLAGTTAAIEDVGDRLEAIRAGDEAALNSALHRLAQAPFRREQLAGAVTEAPSVDAALAQLDAGPPPTPEPPPPRTAGRDPKETLAAALGRAAAAFAGVLRDALAAGLRSPPEPEVVGHASLGPLEADPSFDADAWPATPGPVLAHLRCGDGAVAVGAVDGGGFVVRGYPGAKVWELEAAWDEIPAVLCVVAHPEGTLIGTADGQVILLDEELEPFAGASLPESRPGAPAMLEGVAIALRDTSVRALRVDGDHATATLEDGRVVRLALDGV